MSHAIADCFILSFIVLSTIQAHGRNEFTRKDVQGEDRERRGRHLACTIRYGTPAGWLLVSVTGGFIAVRSLPHFHAPGPEYTIPGAVIAAPGIVRDGSDALRETIRWPGARAFTRWRGRYLAQGLAPLAQRPAAGLTSTKTRRGSRLRLLGVGS
jgi:hypothetical protein